MSQAFQDVLIRVTPMDNEDDVGAREVTLTKQSPRFIIGRASKNTTKGLRPESNNGYFDSPVMSRKHACVHNDGKGNVVLQDESSMHGTYYNDDPIRESLTLKNGMKVTFGTRVYRGMEAFPPKTLKFGIELEKRERYYFVSLRPSRWMVRLIVGSDSMTPRRTETGYGVHGEDLVLDVSDAEGDTPDMDDVSYRRMSIDNNEQRDEALRHSLAKGAKVTEATHTHTVLKVQDMVNMDTNDDEFLHDAPVKGSSQLPIIITDEDNHKSRRHGYGLSSILINDFGDEDSAPVVRDEIDDMRTSAQVLASLSQGRIHSSRSIIIDDEETPEEITSAQVEITTEATTIIDNTNRPSALPPFPSVPNTISGSVISNLILGSKYALDRVEERAHAIKERAQVFFSGQQELLKKQTESQSVDNPIEITTTSVEQPRGSSSMDNLVDDFEPAEDERLSTASDSSDEMSVTSSVFDTGIDCEYSPVSSPVLSKHEASNGGRLLNAEVVLNDDTDEEQSDVDEEAMYDEQEPEDFVDPGQEDCEYEEELQEIADALEGKHDMDDFEFNGEYDEELQEIADVLDGKYAQKPHEINEADEDEEYEQELHEDLYEEEMGDEEEDAQMSGDDPEDCKIVDWAEDVPEDYPFEDMYEVDSPEPLPMPVPVYDSLKEILHPADNDMLNSSSNWITPAPFSYGFLEAPKVGNPTDMPSILSASTPLQPVATSIITPAVQNPRKRTFDNFVAGDPYGGEHENATKPSLDVHEESLPDAQPPDAFTDSFLSIVGGYPQSVSSVSASQEPPVQEAKRVKSNHGGKSWAQNVASVAVPTIFGAILGGVGMFAALVATADME